MLDNADGPHGIPRMFRRWKREAAWCQNGEVVEGSGKLSTDTEETQAIGWNMRNTLEAAVVFKPVCPFPSSWGS